MPNEYPEEAIERGHDLESVYRVLARAENTPAVIPKPGAAEYEAYKAARGYELVSEYHPLMKDMERRRRLASKKPGMRVPSKDEFPNLPRVPPTHYELTQTGRAMLDRRPAKLQTSCAVQRDDLIDSTVLKTEGPTGQCAKSPERSHSDRKSDTGPTKDLPPSRLKAAAVYEWAIETIDGADKMPLRDLHAAILEELDATIAAKPPGAGEVEKLQELRDSLPDNSETFGKYLRDAGIKKYNANGERAKRISHFRRQSEA